MPQISSFLHNGFGFIHGFSNGIAVKKGKVDTMCFQTFWDSVQVIFYFFQAGEFE